ncbi:MAG: hypothetical protein U1E97_09160 [Alphaproteobacteria bacterium]
MPDYPIVKFLVTHGDRFALGVALLPVAAAMLVLALGLAHWLILLAGLGAAALLFVFVKSYVELVRIIADMLLPK